MILIISHPSDAHTQQVTRVLVERGVEPFLLDFSHFTSQSSIKLNFEGNFCEFVFHDNAWGKVDFKTVKSVWWRRPQQFCIPSEILDPHHRMFAMSEARELFGGLSGFLDAYWMNVPERDDLAHRKVFQLRLAQKLGMNLPDTLITNSPEAAREFIGRHGAQVTVFKAFSGTPQAWRETRLIGDLELSQLEAIRYAPVIFQKYIKGSDIRVTVVGEYLYAAEIDIGSGDYPVDFRMNYENLRMKVIDLPKDIENTIRSLMTKLGLVYGAIDFKRTPEDQFIFLEINPAGQWLFVEHHTGQPITKAVADTLYALDRHSP